MTREQRIDYHVQRRLARDRAYIHAENADAQAAREAEIVREVEADLDASDRVAALRPHEAELTDTGADLERAERHERDNERDRQGDG